jgi:hypothetical protein
MDPATIAALAQLKPGPINNLVRKDLLVVASALGIPISSSGPNRQNVDNIKAILNKALANPDLAHAEAYQKFIVYPRGKHAPVKTSLDKRLEDDLLGKSDVVPTSG